MRGLHAGDKLLPQIATSRGQSRKSMTRSKNGYLEQNLYPKKDQRKSMQIQPISRLGKDNRYSRNNCQLSPVISVGHFDKRSSAIYTVSSRMQSPVHQDRYLDRFTQENDENIFSQDEEDLCIRQRNYKSQFYSSYRSPSRDGEYRNNPFSEYIKTCQEKGVIPLAHCFDPKRLKKDEIKMDNVMMGDTYAEAFSNTLPFKQSKTSLNLKNNRLSQNGANAIIKKLSNNIQKLNLSYNPSVKDIDLNILIYDYNRRLRELSIEGNNAGDAFIEKLCNAILERPVMESLNLANNQISNRGALCIANLLRDSASLIALFLRWNNIQSRGAAYICDALQSNATLKILELSFNPIGIGQNKDKQFEKLTELYGDDVDLLSCSDIDKYINKNECNVCENFKNMFIENKTLIHLDLTHCCFSYIECKIMNEGLKENHTILGLHMTGNKMNVDSLGFLRGFDLVPAVSHIVSRISDNLETCQIPENKLFLNTCSNCWICEGWTQVEFKFDPYSSSNPPEKDLTEDDKVFIHFSFENFEPDIMSMQNDGTFSVIRMVPPIKFNYYFTVNGVPKYATDNEKIEIMNEISSKIPYTNIHESKIRTREMINSEYYEKLKCVPRPVRLRTVEEVIVDKPDWDIKESIFWGYMIDTNDIYVRCFDFDWSNCKIPKIVKDQNELEEIRLFLKENYKPIRETYKYYAGISPCGIIPCIGQNVLNDIVNKTGIVDGNLLKLSDVDFEFIATKAGIKNVNLNPERWLVRYQFMEIFVRIALHKYFKQQKDVNEKDKITQSMAVKKLFEEELLPIFESYDCNRWRIEKLWTKHNDELVKANFKNIKRLYDMYSGKFSLPGKQKFMSIDEFMEMISNTNILKICGVGPADVGSCFNISIMTQINELENERHFQMSFQEFIEALFRICKIMTIDGTCTGKSKRSSSFAIENDDESSSNLGAAVEEIEKEQEDITISNLAEKVLYDLKEHADI